MKPVFLSFITKLIVNMVHKFFQGNIEEPLKHRLEKSNKVFTLSYAYVRMHSKNLQKTTKLLTKPARSWACKSNAVVRIPLVTAQTRRRNISSSILPKGGREANEREE